VKYGRGALWLGVGSAQFFVVTYVVSNGDVHDCTYKEVAQSGLKMLLAAYNEKLDTG